MSFYAVVLDILFALRPICIGRGVSKHMCAMYDVRYPRDDVNSNVMLSKC